MKSKSAFSLIELSIVILVIGILIAGVISGHRLINANKIQMIQNLTVNSPINGITNLYAWYETSLSTSFLENEALNGTAVSTWYDNNSQSTVKNNATQSTSGNQPTYVTNSLNGVIPTLRFSGGTTDATGDFFSYDGTGLAQSNYTIFIVERRSGNQAPNYFMTGGSASTDKNLILGYGTPDSSKVLQAHFGDDLSTTTIAYSSARPAIHTFRFSTTNGKEYWYADGSNNINNSDSAQTTALITYTGTVIGKKATSPRSYYLGDMAEIIIFSRALKNEEKDSIRTYLSKKYNIAIS